jgi:hypothetical protein
VRLCAVSHFFCLFLIFRRGVSWTAGCGIHSFHSFIHSFCEKSDSVCVLRLLPPGCGECSEKEEGEGISEWLDDAEEVMKEAGQADTHLIHVESCSYTLNCNWKVYCDNYLVRPLPFPALA